MTRLIDAKALLEEVEMLKAFGLDNVQTITNLITNAPTVQVIPKEIIDAIEVLLKADMTAALSGGSLQRHLPEPLVELRKVFRKYINAPDKE